MQQTNCVLLNKKDLLRQHVSKMYSHFCCLQSQATVECTYCTETTAGITLKIPSSWLKTQTGDRGAETRAEAVRVELKVACLRRESRGLTPVTYSLRIKRDNPAYEGACHNTTAPHDLTLCVLLMEAIDQSCVCSAAGGPTPHPYRCDV